jgi:glycyl-tRNA synthetase beta subunit
MGLDLRPYTTTPVIVVAGSIAWDDESAVFSALDAIYRKHPTVTLALAERPAGVSVMALRWCFKKFLPSVRITTDDEKQRHERLASIEGISGAVIFPGDALTELLTQQLQKNDVPIWYPAGKPK